MTTADKIQMEMKVACAKLGLSAKDMAKALNRIQPMSTSRGAWFAPHIPVLKWTTWRKTTSVWPRSSINGKLIFGQINKRSRPDWPPVEGNQLAPRIKEFATDKELFEARLKGVA